ncbi:MAG: type VI secretion system Vgr family protein [Undibacterium sp.]|uniref:type VI secretion system Vgr family protein n=1 Tax=Undibacterium sp. TaxID=1914977 RepID=UPI002727949D|nr:type VI secretion system Vgr family protein [Undibacterium sp.]MDO8653131.1 type VI secretion system Vgr family protein [Undibacterium sp.]
MLISTDARAKASGSQLDSKEAQAQVEQSQQLQTSLATTAQQHKARLKDDKKQDEPPAKDLPAIRQQEHSATVLKASGDGQAGEHGGQGVVNLAPANINKLSDADFPYWRGWTLVDDTADLDIRMFFLL